MAEFLRNVRSVWRRIETGVLLCPIVFAISVPWIYTDFWHPPDLQKIAGGHDAWMYYLPATFFFDACLRRGEFPLWNPLIYGGTPYAANPQSGVFYPPHLLRGLLTFGGCPVDSLITLRIESLLHLLLAFVGMFCLARDHGISRCAALVSAFGFAYGSWMVLGMISSWTILASLAWFPLSMLILRRLLRASETRGRIRCALVLGAVSGLGFLGGFPQVTLYMGVVMGVYALLYRVAYPSDYSAHSGLNMNRGAWREASGGSAALRVCANGATTVATWFRRDAIALGIALLVALALGAALWIPALEFAAATARSKSAQSVFAFLPRYPLYLLPLQVRIGIVALACAAVSHDRKRDVAVYVLLAFLCLDCFIGSPSLIDRFMRWLAPFKMGMPTRASAVLALPLALLAGFGFDMLMLPARNRVRAGIRAGALVAATTTLTVLYFLWPFCRTPNDLLYYMTPILFICICTLMCFPRGRRVTRCLAVILAGCETVAWDAWTVKLFSAKDPAPLENMNLFERAKFPLDNRRGAGPTPNTSMLELRPAYTGFEDVYIAETQKVMNPEYSAHRYERLLRAEDAAGGNIRGNLLMKRLFWLGRYAVSSNMPPKDTPFPATAAVFFRDTDGLDRRIPRRDPGDVPETPVSKNAIAVPLDDVLPPSLESDPGSPGEHCRLGTFPLPRLHCALRLAYRSTGRARLSSSLRDPISGESTFSADAILCPAILGERLVDIPLPDFERVDADLSIEPLDGDVTVEFTKAWLFADPADENDRIRIEAYGANEARLTVGPLDSARILTFLDGAYPGWQAFVDDVPVRLHVADQAFKAIVVPRGTHEVLFRFRPTRVYIGVAISLAGLALALAGIVLLRPRRADAASRNADEPGQIAEILEDDVA